MKKIICRIFGHKEYFYEDHWSLKFIRTGCHRCGRKDLYEQRYKVIKI